MDEKRETKLAAQDMTQIAQRLHRAVQEAQDVLAEYIVPDSGISDTECVNRLLGILDHQELVRAMRTSPSAYGGSATHRHVKRGSEYVLIGIGKMQAEKWRRMTYPHGPLFEVDMAEVAIYRSADDGSLWVRPREEFEDGRFEALGSEPSQS